MACFLVITFTRCEIHALTCSPRGFSVFAVMYLWGTRTYTWWRRKRDGGRGATGSCNSLTPDPLHSVRAATAPGLLVRHHRGLRAGWWLLHGTLLRGLDPPLQAWTEEPDSDKQHLLYPDLLLNTYE